MKYKTGSLPRRGGADILKHQSQLYNSVSTVNYFKIIFYDYESITYALVLITVSQSLLLAD